MRSAKSAARISAAAAAEAKAEAAAAAATAALHAAPSIKLMPAGRVPHAAMYGPALAGMGHGAGHAVPTRADRAAAAAALGDVPL